MAYEVQFLIISASRWLCTSFQGRYARKCFWGNWVRCVKKGGGTDELEERGKRRGI